MADTSLSDRLARFGLSEKEIDTYLTLLQHGEAKPSEIASDADISKRYVYNVSETLEENGFVEVNSHAVPTTIRAHPPDEVIEALQRDVESMRSDLMELYTEPEPTSEQIEVVKSKATIFKRLRRFIRRADEEVILSIPATYVNEVRQELRDAANRGVLVVLVFTNTADSANIGDEISVLRRWEEVMPTILAVDRDCGVFAPTELLLRSESDRQGIVFVEGQLTLAIIASFFGYWPVTNEVRVTDPAPLPQTYTSFRHAVLQATLHKRAGTDFTVNMVGRRVIEGEDTQEFTGTVTAVKQGLVEPTTNEFPIEHALAVDTGEEVVTVGGYGAFIEDIEAKSVTLRPD